MPCHCNTVNINAGKKPKVFAGYKARARRVNTTCDPAKPITLEAELGSVVEIGDYLELETNSGQD